MMNLNDIVRNDDIKSLLNAVKTEHSVNSTSGDMKNTPLHIAATKGHLKAAEILLQAGADLYSRNKRGALPIHLAVTYHHQKMIDLFISHDSLLFDKTDGAGNTLLHLAVWKRHSSIVEYLLQHGVSVNTKNKDGNTVYHMAVLWNRPFILKMLLNYSNSHIDDVNGKGLAPLHLAAAKGYEECVQLLLMYFASRLKKDKLGKSPVDCANERTKKLFAKYELFSAIKSGCATGMGSIIARRRFDIGTSTALHIACLFSNSRTLIQQLISNGSKVNMPDEDNKTPLYYAIQAGFIGPIQCLLNAGGELMNIKTENGLTPLHIAIQRQDIELTKLYLKRKINVNIEDKVGDTPFLYAVVNRSKDLVNLLLKHEADVNQTDHNGNLPLHLSVTANNIEITEEILKQSTEIIDCKNKYGRTPLMCAILGRNVKLTKLLMDKGASLRKKDNKEVSAYMLAINTNDEGIKRTVMRHGNENELP